MNINNPISYQMARPILFEHLGFVGDVLDIGCNAGANLNYLQENFDTVSSTMGLDYNAEAIKEAKKNLTDAEVCNLNDLTSLKHVLRGKTFDTILIADVLEHILFPTDVVKILVKTLKPKGKIIISLPNTGYYTTLFYFFARKWPRNERGIYDKSHIHLFFKRNLIDVVPPNHQFKIINRTYKLLEHKTVFLDKVFVPIIPYIPIIRDFFTFQYIIEISKI